MPRFRRSKDDTQLCVECMQVNPAGATTCDMCGAKLAPASPEREQERSAARP